MNNKRTNILNNEVVISLDNIEKLSKILAICSLRDLTRKQLQKDLCYHNELDSYLDAYDIIQEASLFLLKFLNKRLEDSCTFVKPTAKKP